jgi:hypothetical protein
MSSSPAPLSTPEGPGSVSGAPNLPEGFTDTFTSRYVDTGDLRQHAVIGGEGPCAGKQSNAGQGRARAQGG